MAKSPSINLIEQDLSSYTPQSFDETTLAIVGFATKGTIGQAKLITSRNDFIEEFGTPPTSYPYGHLAAYRAYNQGTQVLYKRVGDTSGDSTATITSQRVLSYAGDSQKFVLVETKQKGSATKETYIVIDFENNPVGAGNVYQLKVYYDSQLKETYKDISWATGDTNYFKTKINADEDNGGSKWIAIDTYSLIGDSEFDISGDSAGVTYYIGKTQNGDTVEWSFGDSWEGGDYDWRAGLDGIPAGDTDRANLFVVALGTGTDMGNQEENDFHILVTPDDGGQLTQDAAVTLANYRKDFVYIADTPYALEYDEATDWHNGTGGHGRTTTLNNSYACTYWPWLKDYNNVTKEYVWCPPSVFIAEKFMEIDRLYGPWYAAAGDLRGKIIAYDYESSPSLPERDTMYKGLNAINPIVNFATKGLEIFGQKTLLRAYTALNRLTVRRMVIHIKKLIKSALEGLIFEPNNADSWTRATNICNSILEPIRQDNGLDDYRVIIDSSTTTADMIADSTMSGIIKLVPTGTIEVIELTINVYSPGASIDG